MWNVPEKGSFSHRCHNKHVALVVTGSFGGQQQKFRGEIRDFHRGILWYLLVSLSDNGKRKEVSTTWTEIDTFKKLVSHILREQWMKFHYRPSQRVFPVAVVSLSAWMMTIDSWLRHSAVTQRIDNTPSHAAKFISGKLNFMCPPVTHICRQLLLTNPRLEMLLFVDGRCRRPSR